MKNFLLLLVFSGIFMVNAQQVKYKITRDTPEYADFFLGMAGNFYVNTHPNVQHLNMGLDLYGKILTRYRANLFFYRTIAGGPVIKKKPMLWAEGVSGGVGDSPYDHIKSYRFTELVGSFSIIDVIKSRKTKVVLSQKEKTDYYDTHHKTTTTTKFIKVPADHRTILEARGGIISYREIYTGGKIKSDSPGSIIEKGTGNPIAGTIYSRTMVVGIGYVDLKKVAINAEGFGTCSNQGAKQYYFDFLVGSSLRFDKYNTTYNPNTFTFDYSVEKAVDFDVLNPSKMGWRLGLISYPGKTLGMTIKAEIGKFSGLKSMFYTNLSMGISMSMLLEKFYNPALKIPK